MEIPSRTPPSESGFDMASTIGWYSENANTLLERLPNPIDKKPQYPLSDIQYSSITENQISALISLFPQPAIDRSRLKTGSIIGKPTLYFDKRSTPNNPIPTENIEEALSPTAIIPSFIDNSRWIATKIPTGDVLLYELPRNIDPRVREIIHAQGLVHEFAHTIITEILHSPDYRLRLPSGEIVNGQEYIGRFTDMEEEHTPFSHYSSTYRKKGQVYSSIESSRERKVAVDEELAEAITAELLGFVYCEEEGRRLDPFSDRREIQSFVRDFLHARLVDNSEEMLQG